MKKTAGKACVLVVCCILAFGACAAMLAGCGGNFGAEGSIEQSAPELTVTQDGRTVTASVKYGKENTVYRFTSADGGVISDWSAVNTVDLPSDAYGKAITVQAKYTEDGVLAESDIAEKTITAGYADGLYTAEFSFRTVLPEEGDTVGGEEFTAEALERASLLYEDFVATAESSVLSYGRGLSLRITGGKYNADIPVEQSCYYFLAEAADTASDTDLAEYDVADKIYTYKAGVTSKINNTWIWRACSDDLTFSFKLYADSQNDIESRTEIPGYIELTVSPTELVSPYETAVLADGYYRAETIVEKADLSDVSMSNQFNDGWSYIVAENGEMTLVRQQQIPLNFMAKATDDEPDGAIASVDDMSNNGAAHSAVYGIRRMKAGFELTNDYLPYRTYYDGSHNRTADGKYITKFTEIPVTSLTDDYYVEVDVAGYMFNMNLGNQTCVLNILEDTIERVDSVPFDTGDDKFEGTPVTFAYEGSAEFGFVYDNGTEPVWVPFEPGSPAHWEGYDDDYYVPYSGAVEEMYKGGMFDILFALQGDADETTGLMDEDNMLDTELIVTPSVTDGVLTLNAEYTVYLTDTSADLTLYRMDNVKTGALDKYSGLVSDSVLIGLDLGSALTGGYAAGDALPTAEDMTAVYLKYSMFGSTPTRTSAAVTIAFASVSDSGEETEYSGETFAAGRYRMRITTSNGADHTETMVRDFEVK